ncbi:MAG: metal-dependent hydrolase [Myxococcota bacterium]
MSEEIEIVVRRPRLDFEAATRNWMPRNPAFGYQLAGGSLVLPYLEPYLIRIMRQAREALAALRPAPRQLDRLLRDIDLFNGQEANHFKLHARYNALLRERYEGIAAIEAEIERDFARMLREESLAWNLGYSAGFETTGMLTARLLFEAVPESLIDADPVVADLWGWHLAEEYEHRCVALEVFRALGGGPLERVRMYFLQQRHLMAFGERAARLMREQDEHAGRLEITPDRARESKRLERRMQHAGLRYLAGALLPWHDPRRHGPLPGAERHLAALELQSA